MKLLSRKRLSSCQQHRGVSCRGSVRNRWFFYALILSAWLSGSFATASAASHPRTVKPAIATGATTFLSPELINFPNRTVGTTSYPVQVGLFNVNGQIASASSITISGDFAQTNTCINGTGTGFHCFIYVTFTPTVAGERTGTLSVTDASGKTYSAVLSGIGTTAGAGATFSGLTSSGTTGAYTLNAFVLSTLTTGWPTGSVSFVDATAGNASLGTAALGQNTSGLNFGSGPTQAVGVEPSGVVTGDFNGDGKMDFAVANNGSAPCGVGSVSIWLGNGDGTFTSKPDIPLSYCPNNIVAGDFNGDGKIDLAISGGTSSTAVLFGNGDGTFSSSSIAASSTNGLFAAGDFNGDGITDLALVTTTATIYLGQANGTFVSMPNTSTLPANVQGVVVADFNGDGKADLAVAGGTFANPPAPSDLAVATLFGNGDGTLQAPVNTDAGAALWYNSGSQMVATGDFNGDGKPDLVIAGSATGTDGTLTDKVAFSVLLGKGDGSFSVEAPVSVDNNSTNSVSVVTADFDGDGKSDLAVIDDSQVEIYLSKGDGTFTPEVDLESGAASSPDWLSLAVADFNGDGVPDLVSANSDIDGATAWIVHRIHAATAVLANVAVPGSRTRNVVAMYAGDHTFGPSTSSPVSLTASPVPTTLSLSASLSTATLGTQVVLTATLSPSSVENVSANTEKITFLANGTSIGTGTLSSGVATLNITTLGAGTDSITASYAGDANFAASTATAVSVVVTSVPSVMVSPASLTFDAQAVGSTSAGQALTLTNSGTAPLSITSIAASDDFAQTNNCGSTVAPAGTCTINVTFTPTTGGSHTGALTITDNAAGSPQTVSLAGTGSAVTLTSSTSTLSIASVGGSATATIQLGSAGGFSGAVNLTCQVSYQGTGTASDSPTCSLSPTQVTVSGGSPVTTTLTVATTAPASAQLKGDFFHFGVGGTAIAGLLLFAGVPRRRFRGMLLLVLLCVVAASTFSGCGGGSKSNSISNPGTTTGNYKVTVTATSGTQTASMTLPVSVQ